MEEAIADKDELLQVLDECGNETGELRNRRFIHENKLFHNEVACIIVNNKKQILLQKRSRNKKSYPAHWGLCAGHVVGFQPIEKALLTEMKEELGSEIKEENTFLLVPKMKNVRKDNKCFVTCFCSVIDKPAEKFEIQKEEIEEVRWFDFKEFVELVKNEKGTIFKNNEYYNKIINELDKLFSSEEFYAKIGGLIEKLEELDKYGKPTGKIVTREFAHNYGIYHKAVSLFILNEKNEVLLQKRSKTKIRNPGLYDVSVSGHVGFGEDEKEALRREVEEESGYRIDPKDFKFLVSYTENIQFSKSFIDNSFFDVYITKVNQKQKKICTSEVEELKYFSAAEIKKMMKTYEKLAYKPVAFEALIKYLEKS